MLKDGINEIKIKNYDELVNFIRGKDKRNKQDLRKDFVFRGLSNIKYELIPSALRKNKLNQMNINEYIESDYKFKVSINESEAKKYNLTYNPNHRDYDDNVVISFDKYGSPIFDKDSNYKAPENKLQIEREYYILMKFLNYADKCGLKVNAEEISRYLIHHEIPIPFDKYINQQDMIEIMSLAQHYGLPTRALDWTYDYKVSLYFAVKDILSNPKSQDGVLWALNYKLIETRKFNDADYYINLQIYRPEYNTNPNLNAQKGLFTYLIKYSGDYNIPLNEIISSELNKNLKDRVIEELTEGKLINIPINLKRKDTIFYKFIIPKEIKAEILKELYLNGYSEEYLFPGYDGVTKSVINRIKLKNLSTNSEIIKKNILLSVEWDIDKVKSEEKLYEFVKHDFEFDIDRIFIYQNNEVLGHYSGNEIIKDSSEKLWNKFGKYSEMSKTKFDELFEDSHSIAIRLNDLNLFEYPIKLSDFKLNDEFCYIEKNNEYLNFLLNFI